MLKSMCPLLRQASVHPETSDGNRLVFRPLLWRAGDSLSCLLHGFMKSCLPFELI